MNLYYDSDDDNQPIYDHFTSWVRLGPSQRTAPVEVRTGFLPVARPS